MPGTVAGVGGGCTGHGQVSTPWHSLPAGHLPLQSVQSVQLVHLVQGEAGGECCLKLVLCSITHVNINYTNIQTQLSQLSMDGF